MSTAPWSQASRLPVLPPQHRPALHCSCSISCVARAAPRDQNPQSFRHSPFSPRLLRINALSNHTRRTHVPEGRTHSRPRPVHVAGRRTTVGRARAEATGAGSRSEEADVVVIGSGVAGLCAAALLAHYGKKVLVVESHYLPGGCAHAWQQDGYTFEAGPSTYSGMDAAGSPNPLAQVLGLLQEPVEWIPYNRWMCHFPPPVGTFPLIIDGNDNLPEMLQRVYGEECVQQYYSLREQMEPLAEASMAVPVSAVRTDITAAVTLARFVPKLMKVLPQVKDLMRPFDEVMEEMGITHPFLKDWMELSCFMLSGAPMRGTPASEIGAVFAQWFGEGACLQYPRGGSAALAEALVRGIEARGGAVRLRAHVEEVLVEEGRAAGVRLRGGEVLRASAAVISNASKWNTLQLLPPHAVPDSWRADLDAAPLCASFMHLHLGIDATGLDASLDAHHTVVGDWALGVEAEQNVVLVSIPSVLDADLAPAGKHVIHAYLPATEPYEPWQGLDRRSDAYAKMKEERAAPLWAAVEKVIPDVRARVEVELVGTPLTHERFLRRHMGTYGCLGLCAEEGETKTVDVTTPVPGLLQVGDSVFPGPGLPAAAASGVIAANALVPFWEQCQVIDAVVP